GDIFARLGPAETYAAAGLAIYAWGWVRSAQDLTRESRPPTPWRWHLLMIGGAFAAMGSKENFLFMAPLICALCVYAGLKKRLDWRMALSTFLILAYAVFIAGSLIIYLSSAGEDVYGNRVSFASRSVILVKGLVRMGRGFWTPLAIGAVVGGMIWRHIRAGKDPRSDEAKRWLRRGALAALLLACFYAAQLVFYNGALPTHTRYDFPAIAARQFVWVIVIAQILLAIRLFTTDDRLLGESCVKCLVFCLLIVAVFLALATLRGYKITRLASLQNRDKTREFTKQIQQIIASCQKDSRSPVLFESDNVWDYEAVYSARRYLTVRGASNRVFLSLRGYAPGSVKPGLERHLADDLSRKSQGLSPSMSATNDVSFSPISALETNLTPIVVTFGLYHGVSAPMRIPY
ncbi:MAG TPA: hypothetical protein VFC44_07915, partial [Candidatus Saccharimonadales bacterium]|nr:hypothetical protein [Candidatus Saccharimonadales bacterium]